MAAHDLNGAGVALPIRAGRRCLDGGTGHVQLLLDHARFSIDVEHGLNAGKVGRSAGLASKIVGLQEIGIEDLDGRLDDLVDDLQGLGTIGQRLAHAGGEITHIVLHQLAILVDELFAAHLQDMHDVGLLIGERKQLSQTTLGFGARREWLVEDADIDPPGPDCVLRTRKSGLNQLDILLGIDAIALEQQKHWAQDARAEHVGADALALYVGNGLDREYSSLTAQ